MKQPAPKAVLIQEVHTLLRDSHKRMGLNVVQSQITVLILLPALMTNGEKSDGGQVNLLRKGWLLEPRKTSS